MPFIGKNPTAGFSTIVKNDLTPDGSTTAFTLSKNVASANDIAVFVGNVRQEPTDAYSVSGTTLTMSVAPATGLNFYVMHIAGTLESSVVPADGTISSAKIQDDAITDAKIATGITASKLTGALPAISGASLTSLTSANLTGALPAIDGSALTGNVGKVIGVYHSLPTGTTSGATQNLWYDSVVSITFTPISSTSTFLVWYNAGVTLYDTTGDGGVSLRLKRVHNGVTLYPDGLSTDAESGGGNRHSWFYSNQNPSTTTFYQLATVQGYDADAHTTSSITYTLQFASYNEGNVVVGNDWGVARSQFNVLEISS
jgi:hypothetical protein